MAEKISSSELDTSLSQQNVSRARFLRLLGQGLGLSFIPSSLALWGEGSALAASAATILADGRFPIGLWSPPPPAQTTLERYQEIAAAGFNFVIGGNGVTNDNINPAALDAAAANNLRFLLTDGKLRNIIHNSTAATSTSARQAQETSIMQRLLTRGIARSTSPATADSTSPDPWEEVRLRINQLMQLYGGHPALSGLNLYDEPSRAMFGTVGYAREVLQGLAPEQLPYANVWPSYTSLGALGTSTYEDYLQL